MAIALPLAVALSACVTSARNVERTFVRKDIGELQLRSIDLVVVAAGPPRSAAVNLDVKGFDPPAPDRPLLLGQQDRSTETELSRAVAEQLRSNGYAVNLILHADRPSPDVRALPLSPQPSPLLQTSTTATIAPSLQPTATATSARPSLGASTTLRDILNASTADAVLVVRVVPIDTFYVDIGTGTHVEITPLGRERIEDVRPVARQGRLLAGQAFLFDRKTSLRLWTKQLPDYPEGGRLVPGHKFLDYGVTYEPNQSVPPPDARAEAAALAFTRTMFRDFPRAHGGSEAARRSIAGVDVEEETLEETFLDRGHLAVELGAGWSAEHATLDATLGADPLPTLGTGAVAPAGFVRAVPRLVYTAPGGFVLGIAVPFGYAPSKFSRSYQRDNPNFSGADPNDRIAVVKIGHSTSYGLEATAGRAQFLTRSILLVPNAGLFGEVLSADASPTTVIDTATHTRIGVLGGADLWWRPAEDSVIYGRLAGDLKLGLDLGGPLTYGLELIAALGLFL
jgi:hypothetical protein